MLTEQPAEEWVKQALRAALIEHGVPAEAATPLSANAVVEVDQKHRRVSLVVGKRSFEGPLPTTQQFYERAVRELAIDWSEDYADEG